MKDEHRLEQERREFEDQLDMQMLGGIEKRPSKYSQKKFKPVKNPLSNMVRSIVIGVVIVVIFAICLNIYTNERYSTQSQQNIKIVHNAVQLAVWDYHQDTRKYPVTSTGEIDYSVLKNKGYLTINVEEYKGNFKFNSNFQVIKIKKS